MDFHWAIRPQWEDYQRACSNRKVSHVLAVKTVFGALTSTGRSPASDEKAGIALEKLGAMRPNERRPICLSRAIGRGTEAHSCPQIGAARREDASRIKGKSRFSWERRGTAQAQSEVLRVSQVMGEVGVPAAVRRKASRIGSQLSSKFRLSRTLLSRANPRTTISTSPRTGSALTQAEIGST